MNLQPVSLLSLKLLLVVIVFVSCNHQKDLDLIDKAEMPEGLLAKMDTLNNIDPLHSITVKLSADNRVYGKYTGLAAVTSDQYHYYELLQKNASDSQLLELVKQSNVNLKVYALWALDGRHYNEPASLVNMNVPDCRTFQLFSGCEIDTRHINVYFLQAAQNRLDKKEYELYKAAIAGLYSKEAWEQIKRTEGPGL
ncbi:MAG: hypothetical protein IPP72_20955 [Chitinophagaceae bacterium]|nr:hypothetical protein [Chitinophagaceae bacterium]